MTQVQKQRGRREGKRVKHGRKTSAAFAMLEMQQDKICRRTYKVAEVEVEVVRDD